MEGAPGISPTCRRELVRLRRHECACGSRGGTGTAAVRAVAPVAVAGAVCQDFRSARCRDCKPGRASEDRRGTGGCRLHAAGGSQRARHRRIVVCRDAAEGAHLLQPMDAKRVFTHRQGLTDRRSCSCFQARVRNTREWERRSISPSECSAPKSTDAPACSNRSWRRICARCCFRLTAAGTNWASVSCRRALRSLRLFAVEYSLAKLWMSWGIRPSAMIGHSVGEYVAGCLSGVFSLEDALLLVARRGALVQALPGGAMLAVRLPEKDVVARLSGQMAIAAINAPALCVVAGPHDAIATARNRTHRRKRGFAPSAYVPRIPFADDGSRAGALQRASHSDQARRPEDSLRVQRQRAMGYGRGSDVRRILDEPRSEDRPFRGWRRGIDEGPEKRSAGGGSRSDIEHPGAAAPVESARPGGACVFDADWCARSHEACSKRWDGCGWLEAVWTGRGSMPGKLAAEHLFPRIPSSASGTGRGQPGPTRG